MTQVTQTVILDRDLPGPIDRVWRYITEPDLMETWLGRGEIGAVGAPVRIEQGEASPYQSPFTILGEVLINDPPHVLEYTWQPSEEERVSIVRFELREEGDGVRLRIAHSRLLDSDISLVRAGWLTHTEFMLDKLLGRESEPFMDRFRQHHNGPIPGIDE